jgi:basic amino acid/polyamine antiporter, APA family
VTLASGFTSIGVLGELVSIGTLFAFVVVAIGVIVLRRTRPDLERPFKTPGVPWLPALSGVASFALMASLSGDTWIRLVIWMALGLLLYFGYGYRHSRLRAGR